MKKYEYLTQDLRAIVRFERDKGALKPDQEICNDYLNKLGSEGWRLITDPQTMVVTFEREHESRRKSSRTSRSAD